MTDTIKDESLKERLIMVEQQQSHQKEVLLEINDTLREVVKTQHVLANQRKDIDRLTKENEVILKKFHAADIENAARSSRDEYTTKLVESLNKKVTNDIEPQQQKVKTYLKIAGVVSGAGWALFLATLKYWVG